MARISRSVLELRQLTLPAQLGEIFSGSRFLNLPCLTQFLARCDATLVDSPADGLKMALAAPNLLTLVEAAAGVDGWATRVWGLVGSAYRGVNDLSAASRAFRKAAQFPCQSLFGVAAKAELDCRLAALQVAEGKCAQALTLVNRALPILKENGKILGDPEKGFAAALVFRGVVKLFGFWYQQETAEGERFSIESAANDFFDSIGDCQPAKNPRTLIAAIHNLGIVLLSDSFSAEDYKNTIAWLDWAQKKMRRVGIKWRSVPDAKLRWVKALAYNALGLNQKAESLIVRAREHLVELGNAQDLAMISVDLADFHMRNGGGRAQWRISQLAKEILRFDSALTPEGKKAIECWRDQIKTGKVTMACWADVQRNVRGLLIQPAVRSPLIKSATAGQSAPPPRKSIGVVLPTV